MNIILVLNVFKKMFFDEKGTKAQKGDKSEKTKNLIYRRGSIKKKKYDNLRSRYEKYFLLKKGSLPVN